MKKTVSIMAGLVLLGIGLLALPIQAKITAGDITGGAKSPHVNIAIFHKLHDHEGFTYPKNIASDDILHATAGKAQFIALTHTAGLKNDDVIMLSNDVLREGDGDFEDFGVDCQLSVHIKGSDVTLAGMCELLMMDQDGREIEHKGIIKPVTIHSGAAWVLIYYNAEDGIAVYADEEVGLE
ncbi:MAG: hypothetical protein Q9M20_06750 [Mariprofundaceae bacterium]|nr:hypothetical protein [Mariprofundaceae bacterium]